MKRWKMLHKLKDCQNNNLSQRKTSKKLNISRETVRKYWNMDENEINAYLNRQRRSSELNSYDDYLISLLEKYPKIRVPKIRRKLKEKGIEVRMKDRGFRKHIAHLRENIVIKQRRYYAPVLDMVPGAQGQVDLGESREAEIAGEKVRVYFSVMVLSYSRQLYAMLSLKPFNTGSFIEFHERAFKYFNGIPEELVYDQTKLVVIEEKYREVYFNDIFYQYATTAGFNIHVCEGYDPESKGKVEAAVKYIKNDFFYGEKAESWEELEEKFYLWLSEVANKRIHGTTKRRPCDLFYEEKDYLKAYKSTVLREEKIETRRVDKTGLISYQGNKYSVPLKYQRQKISVKESEDGKLFLLDMSGRTIGYHILSPEKGRIILNNNHYRDYDKTLRDKENELREKIPPELAINICRILKNNNPRIYKDQLVGLNRVCNKYPSEVIIEVLTYLEKREQGLRVTLIEEFIKAWEKRNNKILTDNTPLSITKFEIYNGLCSKQHSLSTFKRLEGDRV